MGFAENRIGRPYQAELFFLHALKIDRKLFAAHRELGMLRLAEGDFAEVESRLSQAQKGYAVDKDPELYLTLARAQLLLGLHARAAETLEAILKASPGNAEAALSLAKARRALEMERLYRRIR
jgi:hypothetical protein